jgi:hypothetical protein
VAAALLGVLLAGARAQLPQAAESAALPASFQASVQTGDLVLRRGRSLVSRAVLLSDDRGTYSHAGVAIRRGDSVWVVHAAPATDLGEGVVVREPLAVYLASDRASVAGVYRTGALDVGMRDTLATVLQRYVRLRLPFDGDFDIETPDRLYCTELVWLAFRTVAIELLPHGVRERATPLGTRRYVFPSDLAASPRMRLVATFERPSLSR